MPFDDHAAENIAAWGDVFSLLLLALCFIVGGLSPSRRVWGWPLTHSAARLTVFSLAVIWSLFRLLVESIFKQAGPREFLTATIIYLARWIWLYWRITRSTSKFARIFRVARALSKLHMLRIGFTTDPEKKESDMPESEAVLRYGVSEKLTGKQYWRGVVVREHYDPNVQTWQVFLAERKLHANMLDAFGTIQYLDATQTSLNTAYKIFYDVTMTAVNYRPLRENEPPNDPPSTNGFLQLPRRQQVVRQSPPNTRSQTNSRYTQVINGSAEVDFTPFFDQWGGLPVELIARIVGAEDLRPIGWVARRLAADAVAFINNHAAFRTEEQVTVINRCLTRTLQTHFQEGPSAETHLCLDSPPNRGTIHN